MVVNPRIVEYSSATDIEVEGCLSSRSECCDGQVCRATEIKVEYQDENGKEVKKKLKGQFRVPSFSVLSLSTNAFLLSSLQPPRSRPLSPSLTLPALPSPSPPKGYEARIFQHEFDHIQGFLHLDRFSPDSRKKVQPELDIMAKEYQEKYVVVKIFHFNNQVTINRCTTKRNSNSINRQEQKKWNEMNTFHQPATPPPRHLATSPPRHLTTPPPRCLRAEDASDAILDLSDEVKAALVPPPMVSGRMPPLGEMGPLGGGGEDGEVVKKKKAPPAPKTGFGGGGGGAASTKTKKKKKR